MVVTILDAHVARDRSDGLERAFQEAVADLPPQIVESFLVRDARDATRFQIITVWASHEALESYRSAVEKPEGVQMFEDAGATPELSIMDIVVHGQSEA